MEGTVVRAGRGLLRGDAMGGAMCRPCRGSLILLGRIPSADALGYVMPPLRGFLLLDIVVRQLRIGLRLLCGRPSKARTDVSPCSGLFLGFLILP